MARTGLGGEAIALTVCRWMALLLVLTGALLLVPKSSHGARIKDITKIVGVRNNQLVGYGLVAGLSGTGDKQGTEFTIQSLVNMLVKMGINVDPMQVKVKNVAAVMVTSELPAFSRPGIRLDVLVSSIGDAKSLQGGTLLMTPLQGVDGETYALAQGALSLGGFGAGSGGEGQVKNHLTVGSIPNGAMVERSVVVPLELRERLLFVLNQPDFTTSEAISRAMNRQIGQTVAFSQDSRTVFVDVPGDFKDHVVDFIARLETLEVAVDSPARVVVNERTGTVVMGENVRISTVAVSHGGLSVLIQEEPVISQPSPFGRGRTVVTKDRDVSVEDEESHLMVLPAGVSLGDVVKALNAVGVTPRDLIAILQAMKAAGALSAELVIM